MKSQLPVLCLLITIGSGIAALAQQSLPPATPVHVRWIMDLKKQFGYDSFERVKSRKESWREQQGVTFLTPDEVLVYQVKVQGSPGATDDKSAGFYLQAEIFDARDGREVRKLRFPAQPQVGQIRATRNGAFLVRNGNVLTVYSATFGPVASRELPLSSTASSQEWQIDVSPSGARVIAVHQQARTGDKQKEGDSESKADIEVLDADTLKTIKSFTVPYLNQWSADDDAIVTTDPDGEAGNGDFGIMDFDGKWLGLHTPAESDDPDCPYLMQPLRRQLIAAHDCDALAVVSRNGDVKYSQLAPGGDVLISIAAAGRYLAEAFVMLQSSRVFVRVCDLEDNRQASWVSLEKQDVYYAVSSNGTLAVIDGAKLKLFEPPGEGSNAGFRSQE
jgi:hypothetical protein